MGQARFLLKAYDEQGNEAFPEQEFLGDSQEQAAARCASFVGQRAGGKKEEAPAKKRKRSGGGR